MAELLGKALASVFEQLAEECRARALETEARLEKETAGRKPALNAELPRHTRREENREPYRVAGELKLVWTDMRQAAETTRKSPRRAAASLMLVTR